MMPSWFSWALPIVMSVVSAFVTASFMTGKNVEKLALMNEMLKAHEAMMKELLERIAKLEGAKGS